MASSDNFTPLALPLIATVNVGTPDADCAVPLESWSLQLKRNPYRKR